MRISALSITGFRSIRSIRFKLDPLTVFVGRNGVGKTNLYRSLQLVQAAAAGALSHELAAEGGFDSAAWAGRRQAREPARIAFSVTLGTGDETLRYDVALGLPPPCAAAFALEAEVKEERVTFRQGRRDSVLLERKGPSVSAVDAEGRRRRVDAELMASETALATLADPTGFPVLADLRRTLLAWRFYHDLRTDAGSPLRRPALAVATPTLASDGRDLAAVFATLAFIREDRVDLDRALAEAFPGARLIVPPPERFASFGMRHVEFPKRVFDAGELSDGTLRFLALAGALLGYRLPPFIALNEPESSLHPELLAPLARLVAKASERAQIWVVTHSHGFAAALAQAGASVPREVVKREGETWIDALCLSGDFAEEENQDA